jgi:hypothetical protein
VVYNGHNQAPGAATTSGIYLFVQDSQLYVCNSSHQTCPYRTTAIISPANTNYTLRKADTTFYIKPAPISVVWTDTNVFYTAASQKPSAAATPPGASFTTLPVNVILSVGQTSHIDADRYQAFVDRGALDWNYKYDPDTIYWTIKPALVAVQWDDTLRTYNGRNQVPTASASFQGINIPLSVVDSGTNTGRYTALATTTNTNFHLTDSAHGFNIDSAWARVSWNNVVFNYNTMPQKPIAAAVSTLNGQAVQIAITGEQTDANTALQPTYTARAHSMDANYKLDNRDTTFVILPAPTSVIWDSTLLTYSGQQQTPAAKAYDFYRNEIPLAKTTDPQPSADAGTYKAWVTISGSAQNYMLSNDTTNFVIVPAAIAVQWSNTSLPYTGADTAPSASAPIASSVTLQVLGRQTNAGTYVAAAHPTTALTNYTLTNADTIFEILSTDTLDVRWGYLTQEYTGVVLRPIANIVLPNDNGVPSFLDITFPGVGGNEPRNAGRYRVVVTTDRFPCAMNYVLDGVEDTFTILPRRQTIAFAPAARISIQKGNYKLAAATQDNIPVRFRVVEGSSLGIVTTITADSIVLIPRAVGNVVIEAYIDNPNYAAEPVRRTITIVDGSTMTATVSVSDALQLESNRFKLNCNATSDSVEITITPDESGVDILYGGQVLSGTIKLPAKNAGMYIVEYTLRSINGQQRVDTLRVERPFTFGTIVKQFNDHILYVNNNPSNNGGYTFTGYKWRRDGQEVSASQYYSSGSGTLDGTYELTLTTDAGETIHVCEGTMYSAQTQQAAGIRVYPNPVARSAGIALQTDYPAGTKIYVHDIMGNLVLTKDVAGAQTQLTMPQDAGVYFIAIGSDVIKVIVQ